MIREPLIHIRTGDADVRGVFENKRFWWRMLCGQRIRQLVHTVTLDNADGVATCRRCVAEWLASTERAHGRGDVGSRLD